MPRANSPFLTSISGSLRGGPTFRATSQTPDIVMQTRPVPTDRRTAKQAAVRDAYSRLAYLWKNLSHLDKEPYEIMAEQRNLTPWNCWLSFHLPLMRLTPKFYTAFAEGSGTTIQDFAIGGQTGTANGPVFQEKNQFPNLYFDGVDDRIIFTRPNYYDTSPNFSIFLIIQKQTTTTASEHIIGTKSWYSQKTGWRVLIDSPAAITLEWGDGAATHSDTSWWAIDATNVNTIGIIKNGSTASFYTNGKTYNRTGLHPGLATTNGNLNLGRSPAGSYPFKGNIFVAAYVPSVLTLENFAALDAHYRPFFT